MQQNRVRRLIWAASAASLVLLSGCFQSAGTNPNSLSVADSGPTFTPFPTDLPPPPVTQLVVVTATQDPNAFLLQDFPTSDPNTGLAIPESTLASDVAAPLDLSQLDPLDITATYIVGGATSTAGAFATQTAQAIFGFPTATATPDALFLTPTSGVVVPGQDCTHVVVAGENLFRIAMRYNTTIDAIARASGITNSNTILVGQNLTIPGCGTGGTGGVATQSPGTGAGTTYTVQQGDTLFKISLQYGVPVTSIASANGITDINTIFINQQLVIPAA